MKKSVRGTCYKQVYRLNLKKTNFLAIQTIIPTYEFVSSKFYISNFHNM